MEIITYTRAAKCKDCCMFYKKVNDSKRKKHTCTNPESERYAAVITSKDLLCDKWKLQQGNMKAKDKAKKWDLDEEPKVKLREIRAVEPCDSSFFTKKYEDPGNVTLLDLMIKHDREAKVSKLGLSDASAFAWNELSEKEEKSIRDIYTGIDRYMQHEIRKALGDRGYYFDSDERFLKFCGEHLELSRTKPVGSPSDYIITVLLRGTNNVIIVFDSRTKDTGPFSMEKTIQKREVTEGEQTKNPKSGVSGK